MAIDDLSKTIMDLGSVLPFVSRTQAPGAETLCLLLMKEKGKGTTERGWWIRMFRAQPANLVPPAFLETHRTSLLLQTFQAKT